MLQVLQRAASLLELVASAERPVSFSEIERAAALNKATMAHILKALVELDYLSKGPDGRYGIGETLAALSRARKRRETLSEVADEHARALAEELRESVVVSTLHKGNRYTLAKASVDQSISVSPHLETGRSPFDSATGRTLLAHLDRSALAKALRASGLPGGKWPEVRTRGHLDRELRQIRDARIAVWRPADRQSEAIAVPVFGPEGGVRAAIGVVLPTYRSGRERRRAIAARLRATSERMGHALALQWRGDQKERRCPP